MAVASTSLDYPFNSKKHQNSNDKEKLDFYESMYHFRKMFPKFDSDVIETILRSNKGSVDKTLDQLLSMSVDCENFEPPTSSQAHSCLLTSEFNSPLSSDGHDLPPSYNEIMSSSSVSSVSESSKTKSDCDDFLDFNNNRITETPRSSLYSVESDSKFSSKSNLKSSFRSTPSFIRNFNQMVVGELSKDFLRIKLTKDQTNAYKNSIKVAKRDEIVALLNNKIPKHPELSFELKRQLDSLMNQLEENETDLEDWEEKYKNLLQSFESKRLQIIQDEYLAKLLQNEEFLNEIRTDQDFINTLNDETDTVAEFDYELSRKYKNHDQTNKTLSNAELLAKLSKMGKTSKSKLNKLASKFLTKKKSKSPKYGIEFNTIDFNSFNSSDGYSSTGSSLKEDINNYDINENTTYDLERIKAEEMNFGYNSLSKTNRYKKAYKSIKSAIKRNNSNQSPASSYSDLNGHKGYDFNKNGFF